MTQFLYALVLVLVPKLCFAQTYQMPAETSEHEGTWLQWPHQYEYGTTWRNRLDATWVAMANALISSEKVHIIAYNTAEKTRIINLLTSASVSLVNIDFKIFPTNDVWIRDNGPIFVRNASGILFVEDWGFDGWGGDYNYNLCNPIPTLIGASTSIPVVNLNSTMVVEGGSYELAEDGVFIATKSAILTQTNSNGALAIRNPGMTQGQAETIFTQYIGATKFIWLDGFLSSDDITDAHIDGFAKFATNNTLVTMNSFDLNYWGLSSADVTTLYSASNAANVTYNKVYLPLTQNDVVTSYGNNLGYKGSYINYYIANSVVLVPNYNDPNDLTANSIIQGLHPGKTVVGIDCRNLYENGGMVHCVTQQQPITYPGAGLYEIEKKNPQVIQNFPNPFSETTSMQIDLPTNSFLKVSIYNLIGEEVLIPINSFYAAGNHTISINSKNLNDGIYTFVLKCDNIKSFVGKMVVSK